MESNEKGLPPELMEALEKKEVDLRHNWMYSFMPVTIYDGMFVTPEDKIYLVGYCKQCNNSVSVGVAISPEGNMVISPAGIPKWGCKPSD